VKGALAHACRRRRRAIRCAPMDLNDHIVTAIIAGVTGLISGVIGSLVAPWIGWGIEKKRRKLDARTKLVARWREVLGAEDFDRSMILNDPTYGVLAPLLDAKERKQVQRPQNHLIVEAYPTRGHNPDRTMLLHEVARIEKLWKLLD